MSSWLQVLISATNKNLHESALISCDTFRILAKKLNIPWRKLRNFAELQNELKVSLEEIITNADQLLPKEIYTRQDVIQELDITSEELNADILTPNTKHLEEFKIRQRTLHVFQGIHCSDADTAMSNEIYHIIFDCFRISSCASI